MDSAKPSQETKDSLISKESQEVTAENYSGWMACPRCDELFDLTDLKDGDRARCSKCGEFLTDNRPDGLHRVLASGIAAFVFLLIALAYPFLSFQSSGVESVMTLPGALSRLIREGMGDLAIIVGTVTLVIPTIVLWLAASLSFTLIRGWSTSWSKPVARWIFRLKTWSMAEVFLIGVLISLVKIMGMASVSIGISFWAYVGFIVSFTLTLSNLDTYQVWNKIEALEKDEK